MNFADCNPLTGEQHNKATNQLLYKQAKKSEARSLKEAHSPKEDSRMGPEKGLAPELFMFTTTQISYRYFDQQVFSSLFLVRTLLLPESFS
jgi:hypothetical protein